MAYRFEQILYRSSGVYKKSFDEQPMSELSSEVIDFEAASEQLNHVRKLSEKDLETLEIITHKQGKKVPTVGGVILFGKEREKYFSVGGAAYSALFQHALKAVFPSLSLKNLQLILG